METKERPRDRRRFRNMLLDPQKQYRHALTYFAFTAVGALLFQTILWNATKEFIIDAMIASGVAPEVLLRSMRGSLRAYLWRSAMLFPALAMFSLIFGIRMTHRFLGPQVALKRTLAALRNGEYDQRVNLRKNDELQEIAAAINELGAALETRHGATVEERAA